MTFADKNRFDFCMIVEAPGLINLLSTWLCRHIGGGEIRGKNAPDSDFQFINQLLLAAKAMGAGVDLRASRLLAINAEMVSAAPISSMLLKTRP